LSSFTLFTNYSEENGANGGGSEDGDFRGGDSDYGGVGGRNRAVEGVDGGGSDGRVTGGGSYEGDGLLVKVKMMVLMTEEEKVMLLVV
jgi:hypothetical protein